MNAKKRMREREQRDFCLMSVFVLPPESMVEEAGCGEVAGR
ncbi:MAG: hypothetical protein N2V78_00890 [Methanophagales archaeon]|nr:hypothetical protein [Methanophagales archaeon]